MREQFSHNVQPGDDYTAMQHEFHTIEEESLIDGDRTAGDHSSIGKISPGRRQSCNFDTESTPQSPAFQVESPGQQHFQEQESIREKTGRVASIALKNAGQQNHYRQASQSLFDESNDLEYSKTLASIYQQNSPMSAAAIPMSRQEKEIIQMSIKNRKQALRDTQKISLFADQRQKSLQ